MAKRRFAKKRGRSESSTTIDTSGSSRPDAASSALLPKVVVTVAAHHAHVGASESDKEILAAMSHPPVLTLQKDTEVLNGILSMYSGAFQSVPIGLPGEGVVFPTVLVSLIQVGPEAPP